MNRTLDTDRYYDACADAPRLPALPDTPLNRAIVDIARSAAFRLTDRVENEARRAHRWKLQRAADALANPTAESVTAARELILTALRGM